MLLFFLSNEGVFVLSEVVLVTSEGVFILSEAVFVSSEGVFVLSEGFFFFFYQVRVFLHQVALLYIINPYLNNALISFVPESRYG